MARVKRGVTARRRHKKVLGRAKGYYNARRKVYRVAKQAVIKADQYAYIGRKQKKRHFRRLWIVRVNAAARQFGLSYSRLINGLSKAGITMDRKVLADLAVHDMTAFGAIAAQARAALDGTPAPVSQAVTPVVPAKAAKPETADNAGAAAAADDYTRIEGIGPKIDTLLHEQGLARFADLAAATVDELSELLHEAGSQFASHDPSTWPKQAKLAAAGKFDELDALQSELLGGREDLTRIEGVGPKTADLLHENGITSFANLAAVDVDTLEQMLHEAGSGFAAHDPSTWPKQAKLAAAGKFDELDALQAELDGGRAN